MSCVTPLGEDSWKLIPSILQLQPDVPFSFVDPAFYPFAVINYSLTIMGKKKKKGFLRGFQPSSGLRGRSIARKDSSDISICIENNSQGVKIQLPPERNSAFSILD